MLVIRFYRNIKQKVSIYRQRRYRLAGLGKHSIVDPSVVLVNHANVKIGDYCRIGPDCHLDGEGGLSIGDGTILGPHITVLTSTHRYNQTKYLPYDECDEFRKVVIGKGCWIGWGAMIAPGVLIGDGAVVAMGAVVVSDVSAGEVVGGNPAKKISSRENVDFIKKAIQEERYYIKAKKDNNLKRKPIDEI